MRKRSAESKRTMTNTETTDTAANVAAQGAQDAPEQTSSKKTASRKKGAPKSQKGAKSAKPKAAATYKAVRATKKAGKPTAEKKAKTPRGESKGAKILEMIGRAKGATLAEIMKAADWQAHSVRGFISSVGKKLGIKIDSSKREDGERVYKLVERG